MFNPNDLLYTNKYVKTTKSIKNDLQKILNILIDMKKIRKRKFIK